MVKVRAITRGYFGGELRDPGDRDPFDVPDDLWKDEKRRPKWAKLAAFDGKGDHDGDGLTGGSKPVDPAGDDDADDGKAKGKRGRKGKVETVQPETAEPFGDAPPVRVENEINDATGGTAPDWLPPSSDAPVQADD